MQIIKEIFNKRSTLTLLVQRVSDLVLKSYMSVKLYEGT
jgi:hypothetical protein